jgi:hypothetical protein
MELANTILSVLVTHGISTMGLGHPKPASVPCPQQPQTIVSTVIKAAVFCHSELGKFVL